MIAVLDVSAAVEIILQREKKDLFIGCVKQASWVIAPGRYIAELSNVFWKYHKAKAISRADCFAFVEDGINLIDDFVEEGDLWKEALSEGCKNNHSVYDMHYAILARRNNGVLLTNDRALSKICAKMKIETCH
ncbi:MAG TPA: PIN domain nuclease [Candidatus Hydrogenedentes bacterium]|nr:PIN domain nuclease [Candidatus Hydrogenedentota bacterium]